MAVVVQRGQGSRGGRHAGLSWVEVAWGRRVLCCAPRLCMRLWLVRVGWADQKLWGRAWAAWAAWACRAEGVLQVGGKGG